MSKEAASCIVIHLPCESW